MVICSESQTGKKSADWAVRTVRTATWQGHTIMVTWKFNDVAYFYWLVVVQSGDGTCHL
jgi:hypothetical protein